jgi:hypothetical protein
MLGLPTAGHLRLFNKLFNRTAAPPARPDGRIYSVLCGSISNHYTAIELATDGGAHGPRT